MQAGFMAYAGETRLFVLMGNFTERKRLGIGNMEVCYEPKKCKKECVFPAVPDGF